MDDRTTQNATTTPPKRTSGTGRRWLAAGILGLTLGAVLLGGTAFAQTDSTGTDQGQSFLERLAEKLGITSDELVATVKETRTEMVDEAVADGRLTESQGEALKQRIEDADGSVLGGLRERAVAGYVWRQLEIDLESIAAQLQLSSDDLRAQLEAGATLEEVIVAQGLTVDAVVAALVSDAETTLAQAVADGDLTQEQADQILSNLPERLTQMIENGLPGDCDRRFNRDDDTDDSDDAEATPSQV